MKRTKNLKKKKKKRIKNKKELLFKSIIVSIYDVDRFEKKEMKKKRSIKKHLVEWVINDIPDHRRQTVHGF